MTVRCPVCGYDNPQGEVFCQNPDCGQQLPDEGLEPKVECPACKAWVPVGPRCDQCGAELVEPLAAASATTPPPASPVPVVPPTTLPVSPPATPPAAAVLARLVVTRGAQVGVEYPLVAGENEIGRWDEEEGYMPHIDLDAQDADGYVHRKHAMIRFDGSQWWLEHLKEPPSNPTRIRDRGDRLEVGKPVPLQNGDEIVVGRTILKFVIG